MPFDLGHSRTESTDHVEPSGVEAVARQSLQGHIQVQRGLVDGSLDLHRNQKEGEGGEAVMNGRGNLMACTFTSRLFLEEEERKK